MSNTKVNLNEVKEFNSKIKEFSKNIDNCFDTIERSLNELNRSWDDPMFQQFKRNFNKHSIQLKPLSEQLNKYNKHVDDYWVPKIEKVLEQYKNNP